MSCQRPINLNHNSINPHADNLYSVQFLTEFLNARGFNLADDAKLDLGNLSCDGRKIKPGAGFIAINGSSSDGHAFLGQAFQNGAAWAVVQNQQALAAQPGFVVHDTRKALSQLAALAYGQASKGLKLIGVTGTNGKTTTNWLICHALNILGLPCLRIGTLGIEAKNLFSVPGDLTTPDALSIQAALRRALDLACQACVMETSSHALDQARVDDIEFDVGIFTNLTRDHLDYHGQMTQYFKAKMRLFELLSISEKKTKAAVINVDTAEGQAAFDFAHNLKLHDFSFGRTARACIRIIDFKQFNAKSELQLQYLGQQFLVKSDFIGQHNAENLAAAFAALISLGIEPHKVCEALGQLPQVPGRLEQVGNRRLGIYVDYAHTPDALAHALKTLRQLQPRQLWVVFGCGGDRDSGKRPQMGLVAEQLADQVVVTSDNPRTEQPENIIADILSAKIKTAIVDSDRENAIRKTLEVCQPGDIVLIAGKGHEDYQIIGKQKLPFSDQEIARKYLRARQLV